MNERIKELALKAGFKNYGGTSLYSPYIEGMELNDELQEFAELIIKECFVQMEKESRNCSMLMSYPPQSSAIWDAKNNIRKHFGVE